MKFIFTWKSLFFLNFFSVFFLVNSASAQAPQSIPYQGAVRNLNGTPVGNKKVAIRLSILDKQPTGATLYSEIREITTSPLGLYTASIGSSGAKSVTGDFKTIGWGTGDKFLKVEIDVAGGSNFALAGTNQLLSVPYALYAEYAKSSIPGPAGKSIESASISNGQLILVFTDGTTLPVPGSVMGPKGDQGVSVTNAAISTSGHLMLTLSSGQTVDAGLAKGADGKPLTFADLTQAQIDALKGPQGPVGPEGLRVIKVIQVQL